MWYFNKKNKLVEFGTSENERTPAEGLFPTKQDALLSALEKSNRGLEQAMAKAQMHRKRIEAAKKQLQSMQK